MKVILYLGLLFPLRSFCQTVHVKDEKIDYSAEVRVGSSPVTAERIQKALQALATPYAFRWVSTRLPYQVRGSFHLRSSYQQLRLVYYTLKVAAWEGGYRYHLYEVSLREGERGGEAVLLHSKELLKGLEDSGAPAAAAERTLNEIDMDIQALLVKLEKQIAHPKG